MSNPEKPKVEITNRSSLDSSRSRNSPIGLGVGALLLITGVAIYWTTRTKPTNSGPDEIMSGTVTHLWRAGSGNQGLEICAKGNDSCKSAAPASVIAAPSRLQTDERTRVKLGFDQNLSVTMDRNTELQVPQVPGRNSKLIRGSAVIDSNSGTGRNLEVQVPGAKLEVGLAKVGITADSKGAVIDVAHGVLKIIDDKHHEATVRAGEQVRIVGGSARGATNNATLGEELLWSQPRVEESPEAASRGLGELIAKKPGSNEEQRGVVSLASHKVEVRIVANLVRTQVDETFVNSGNDVLEGIYRFPLPNDAKIERLALDVNGKLEEGAFVDRDRAAAIWRGAIVNATPADQRIVKDDIVWVPGPWRDPALLEWQRGGRFELRIYPIPKHGSRHVVMTYTQISVPSGDARRYTYPLAYDPSGTTKVGHFELDVQVRGHDADYGVRSLGYTLRQSTDSGTSRLSLSENEFTPHGDIVLEYALPQRDAELKAWAYAPSHTESAKLTVNATSQPQKGVDSPGFAAFSLRPNWPRRESNLARDVVVVVDSSRSMLGENLKRAQRLAVRLTNELEPTDRASVIACDAACQVLPEGMLAAGPELAQATEKFISSIRAEGASDPTAAVHSALVLAGRGTPERPLSIVYVGDGTPTAGPIRPGTIEKAVEHELADASATVFSVGVGSDSDQESLHALARGGGGLTVNYQPGKNLDEVAYTVVGAIRGSQLRDVRVTLPEGLVDASPRRPEPLGSGSELWVLARMQRAVVRGDVVLRGRLLNQAFERRWPIELTATSNDGNAFVPRLFAAAKISDLERLGDADAKREVIELSQIHHVASRYTSLLVLESEAMFKAFSLKKTEQASEWTGETDDDQQVELTKPEAEGSTSSQASSGGSAPAKAKMAQSEKKAEMSRTSDKPAAAAASPSPASRRLRGEPEQSDMANEYATPPPAPIVLAQKSAETVGPSSAPPMNDQVLVQPAPARRVTMIPMRRVWERKGSFTTERVPADANLRTLTKAEDDFDRNPERRQLLKGLLALYTRRGELDHSDTLVERWVDKEPLDSDALTARADAAMRRGLRDDAIRLLGSVIDVRPDDVKAQQRLARLYRWSGERELACRFMIALSEFHADKSEWLAQAVRCTRNSESPWLADELLGNASDSVRAEAERALARAADSSDALLGDLRVEAEWSSDADVDLALITPDGQRVSWLGAPTRQVITARNVTSRTGESLAVRNAPPGSYVVELVRVAGSGVIRGNLSLTIADLKRTVPFTLRDDRTVAGIATIRVSPKLIPVTRDSEW